MAWDDEANTSWLDRHEEALEALDKALELYTEEYEEEISWAWTYKSNAYNWLNRYEEALEAANMAIEYNPQNGAAWEQKGKALEALGRYDEAREAYKQERY